MSSPLGPPEQRRLERAGVVVRWLGGGLFLRAGDAGWIVDPTPVGVQRLSASDLRAVRGVVLTAGVASVAAGWLCLLDALGPIWTGRHLCTVYPIGDGRIPALAEVWHGGMPGAVRIELDGVALETIVRLGALEVRLRAVRRGEPDWRAHRVLASPGGAVQLRIGGVTVVWIPPAASGSRVRRLTHGVDLAIVALSSRHWPATEHPWRATLTEAVRDTAQAAEVWFVDELGHRLDHGPTN